MIIEDVAGAYRDPGKKGYQCVDVFRITNLLFGIVESCDSLAQLGGFFGGNKVDVVVHMVFPQQLSGVALICSGICSISYYILQVLLLAEGLNVEGRS